MNKGGAHAPSGSDQKKLEVFTREVSKLPDEHPLKMTLPEVVRLRSESEFVDRADGMTIKDRPLVEFLVGNNPERTTANQLMMILAEHAVVENMYVRQLSALNVLIECLKNERDAACASSTEHTRGADYLAELTEAKSSLISSAGLGNDEIKKVAVDFLSSRCTTTQEPLDGGEKWKSVNIRDKALNKVLTGLHNASCVKTPRLTMWNMITWDRLYTAHLDTYTTIKKKRRILNFKRGANAEIWREHKPEERTGRIFDKFRSFMYFLTDDQISIVAAEDFGIVCTEMDQTRKRERMEEERDEMYKQTYLKRNLEEKAILRALGAEI